MKRTDFLLHLLLEEPAQLAFLGPPAVQGPGGQGVHGGAILGFGDAPWWSAALLTTIRSDLHPVGPGGRVLGFSLAPYALGVSYFMASVLVGLDVVRSRPPAASTPPGGLRGLAAAL